MEMAYTITLQDGAKRPTALRDERMRLLKASSPRLRILDGSDEQATPTEGMKQYVSGSIPDPGPKDGYVEQFRDHNS